MIVRLYETRHGVGVSCESDDDDALVTACFKDAAGDALWAQLWLAIKAAKRTPGSPQPALIQHVSRSFQISITVET